MIQHFVTINGTIALIMIDNNSTLSTQEQPSNQSPSTLSPEPTTKTDLSIPRQKVQRRVKLSSDKSIKSTRLPFWKTVPLGMLIERKKGTGSKYTMRKGRPTTSEINKGRPVGKNYNYVFIHDGQRTYRTFDITFTSPINRAKTFKFRIAASSLRMLFKELVYAIGNLRATETIENFSLHFEAVSQKEGVVEEVVHIPLAEELDPSQRPSTDEPVEPIIVED